MSFQDIDLQWFAAEDEGRTEEPSELKLRRAREEGRIAKSQELTGALVFLFSLVTFIFLAKSVLSGCADILSFFFTRINSENVAEPSFFMIFVYYFLRLVIPVTMVGIVAGILGNIIQNKGMIFSLKVITPKFSKIIPKFGEYFKKTLFSFEGTFNVIKSITKVAVIFMAAYLLIRSETPKLLTLMNANYWDGIVFIAETTAKLLIITSIIFIIIATKR